MSVGGRLHPDDIRSLAEQLAPLLVERLSSSAAQPPPLLDANEVAEYLGMKPSWVYEHALALGGRRAGAGGQGRWRFRLEDVDAALAAWTPVRESRQARRPVSTGSAPLPPEPDGTTAAQLLPIRGRES